MVSAGIAVALFLVGAALAVCATERLLGGIVGLATALRLSAFVVGAALSGLEVENIAVGLASGAQHLGAVALGTVYGGAIFVVCVALGLGAIIAPLEVRLPRGMLLLVAASPVVAGLGLIAPTVPRWVGVVLLVAFVGAMTYVVIAARQLPFPLASHEVAKAQQKQGAALADEDTPRRRRTLWRSVGLTVVGLVVIAGAGELVARGAEGIIAALGVPALVMGMIISPAAVELEEVARQAIPAKRGRSDVSAGNLVGTLLYFLLCNLGLIALLTPVRVDPLVRALDWPVLLVVTWVAVALLWRGRVGRGAGMLLLAAYAGYIVLHVVFR